jgi:hypothetical protein
MFLKKKSHNLITKSAALVLKGIKGSVKVKAPEVKHTEEVEVTPIKKANKKASKVSDAE